MIKITFKKGQIPWNKGIPRPLEVNLKISEKRKGQHNSTRTEFKKGVVPWNKEKRVWDIRKHPMMGTHRSQETRKKLSETRKKLFELGKIKSPFKGKHLSEETKLKLSKSKIGKPNPKSSETKRKLFAEGKIVPWNKGKPFLKGESNPFFGKTHTEETKKFLSQKMKEWHKNHKKEFIESRKKTSLTIKKLWKTPDWRSKVITNSLKGLWKRPNSLETKMIEFIQKNKLNFKFCGDGTFLIGFKNPDFVDENNKICMEVANRFHHPGKWAEQRIAHFEKFGWKCIVVWWEDIFMDKQGFRIRSDWEENVSSILSPIFSYGSSEVRFSDFQTLRIR